MKDWRKVFLNAANSGVYFDEDIAGGAEICRVAESLGLTLFHLDLKGASTKQGFLKVAADVFRFPDYFGGNWDAFADCLKDLAWCKAKDYVILIENMEGFTEISPEEMSTACSIMEDVAGYWKKQDTRFFVVLAKRIEGCARS